jgi:hypothetical protein
MQNVFGGLDFAGSMAAMGLLGSGSAPGVGGSTYNPLSQFLSGTSSGLNLRTTINPATINSSILRNR